MIRRPMLLVLLSLAACRSLTPAVVTPGPVAKADSAVRRAIAAERSIDVNALPARSIAVTPFQFQAADTSLNVLGFGLADLLITDLARSRQLEVVDRLRIDAYLRETGLAASGRVDPATAPRVGKLVGARRLVVTQATAPRGQPVRFDSRLADVANGQVRTVAPVNASVDQILDAEKSLAFRIFEGLAITLTPAERALVEQRPTRDLAALLAYSRGVRAEVLRDYRVAQAEYRSAVGRDGRFANAVDRLAAVDRLLLVAQPPRVSVGIAGPLALEGINPSTLPVIPGAAEPGFQQRLRSTIIIVINLP